MPPLLDVAGLCVEAAASRAPALREVSFSLGAGEILCLVGESGSGKTMTALTLLGLEDSQGLRRTGGRAVLDGRDLFALGEDARRDSRGRDLAMVFQEPMTALSPVHRAGDQAARALIHKAGLDRARARAKVLDLFSRTGLAEPERVYASYPFELSGGMRQRVMIALALARDPKVLLADEPVTALDAPVQARIAGLLAGLARQRGMGLAVITHDLGLAASLADTLAVMYAGRIVERAGAADFFAAPAHPYAKALLDCLPGRGRDGADFQGIPGSAPPLTRPPAGCPFHPRCAFAADVCRRSEPRPVEPAPGRLVRCHFPLPAASGGRP